MKRYIWLIIIAGLWIIGLIALVLGEIGIIPVNLEGEIAITSFSLGASVLGLSLLLIPDRIIDWSKRFHDKHRLPYTRGIFNGSKGITIFTWYMRICGLGIILIMLSSLINTAARIIGFIIVH